MSASEHICRLTFACGSRVMAIGISPADGSNATQDLAFAVLAEIEDRGAMQAEENAIEPTTLDRGDDRIAEPLERRALYLAARSRRRAEDVFDLPAMRPARIEEAGQLGIGLASRGDGLVSDQNVAVPERLLCRSGGD